MNTTSRPTYRHRGSGYEAVVKDGAGKVVASCGHIHRNRYQGSSVYGPSALQCAEALRREIGGATP
jgi:L-asparaginase II